ncbi:MAG: Gfo/Idh/MocA family oxidoreductase [Roseburia sp.]|nr:Gfo/Idh/MocA family oxidoreductase [Roseburia sp.]
MRVGIIGCGCISEVHAKSIMALEDSELVSVADCVPERARRLAARYGGSFHTDWMEMLEQEKLDVVHICTPHYLHAAMAVECLDRGIHVFMEKPPVISWEQFHMLKEAVNRQSGAGGIKTGVCFQNRRNPEVQFVRKLLRENYFGSIVGVRGIVTWCRDKSYYAAGSWRGKKHLAGGGALINQGIHTLDLIQYLVDEKPCGVEAMMDNFHLKEEIEVEDTLCAHIRYSQAAGCLYVTTGYAADAAPVLELQCERGRIRMEEGSVFLKENKGEEEIIEMPGEKGFGKDYWGAGHGQAIEQFYNSIQKGESDILDFENVEETLRLFLRIYDSAYLRETVK